MPTIYFECAEATVEDFIQRPEDFLNLDLFHLYVDISRGVRFIHDQGFLHRDLSSDNIPIVHGIAKIADFGFSCTIALEEDFSYQISYNAYYKPPRQLRDQYNAHEMDVWSCGGIFQDLNVVLAENTSAQPFRNARRTELEPQYFDADGRLKYCVLQEREKLDRKVKQKCGMHGQVLFNQWRLLQNLVRKMMAPPRNLRTSEPPTISFVTSFLEDFYQNTAEELVKALRKQS